MPETSAPHAIDVLSQLATGPSITEVASNVLRPVLKTLYPQLNIEPSQVTIVTPTWLIGDYGIGRGNDQFESLTDALVRLAVSGAAATYIDGEHFLTEQPGVESPPQLPVQIETIGVELNKLAPLLFSAYQEQQVDYWNDPVSGSRPRWHQLSQTLQQLWNVSDDNGWDADQRAMAHAVFSEPDKTLRSARDRYQTRAYLVDLDLGDDTDRKHLNILDTAVLVGSLGERTLILTHSITEGFQRFDSFEELGKSLRREVQIASPGNHLHWRLFEPTGNFFHHQACTLIALQAQAIGQIDFFRRPDNSILLPLLENAGNRQPDQRSPRFTSLDHRLPQWLENASPADQTRYSRHLLDLVGVQQQNAGKTFQNALPGIKEFTLGELQKQISQGPAPARNLQLQNVEISVTSVVVWGTFTPPIPQESLKLSLVELALQNLLALPLGNTSVSYSDGSAVPTWMTPAYVENLVTSVNIGERYPALLQNRLVDDKVQAANLEQLYSRQLPIELPLLALQHKIRGEFGIDEKGYRYVVAALAAEPTDRHVDGQEIVICPLAFRTGNIPANAVDEVVNMFVIGPRTADNGPCLLYRPLLDPPLLQYSSPANLLYAIKHSKTLRQSVLAWLPDSVRFNYSQYVFAGTLPSVWTVPQLLVDPTLSPYRAGQISLGGQVIENDVLSTLFKANARALITQADRQSVSNAEARWATLKRGGWALFNAALPFLGRSIGTAAWIWQIMDDLQEVADAQEQQQSSQALSALTDLLLALGMVLAHRAAARGQPQRTVSAAEIEERQPTAEIKSPPSVGPTRLPDIVSHELPHGHQLALHDLGALGPSQSSLGNVLGRLEISRPQGLAAAQTEGPHKHLRASGQKWYAQVGENWFEVELNDNDDVQIIDSRQQPPRHGPLLINNDRGQWFIDLRLRLRGGGLRSRRKQIQQQNAERLRKIKQDISAFDTELESKRLQLINVRRAMLEATAETADGARRQFLDTLNSQVAQYSAHLEDLKALHILEAVPNYRSAMLERITLQLFLMQSWIDECNPRFRESMRSALDLLDESNNDGAIDHSQAFETTTDLTQAMIDKLEFAQTRFAELSLLGKEAAEVSREFQAKLPPFKVEDLKLLQITLSPALCLKAGSGEIRQQAILALEDLIEDATLNIQSALDLSSEDSLHHLGERIEALNSLVEQFSIIDQRFLDFAAEFAEYQNPERLEHARKRVAQFSEKTVQQLSSLLLEKRLLEPVAGPSKPPAPPARKIIKTRFKGTLVGQPRRNENGTDSGLVDVLAPLTGKVIATFHEKSPGVWLERVPVKKPAPPKPAPGLSESLQAGQALLDELPAFNRRTEAHIGRAQRNPTEIEELYYLHASRLRDAMTRIDQALTAGNHTESRTASAATLRQQLEHEATALYALGRSTRITLIKQQAPTAARVEWLASNGEVHIPKAATRRRLKGPRKDYLLEYEILDKKTNQVLWYAHFHYANPTDPLESFTAAHLKTVEQRRLGGAYEWREGNSNQELIAIHRSAISRTQAAALFFS